MLPLAGEDTQMERNYWLGRERSALSMAHKSTNAETKLIHFELAGRYSLKALSTGPFMLPCKASAVEGERSALAVSPAAPAIRRHRPTRR